MSLSILSNANVVLLKLTSPMSLFLALMLHVSTAKNSSCCHVDFMGIGPNLRQGQSKTLGEVDWVETRGFVHGGGGGGVIN